MSTTACDSWRKLLPHQFAASHGSARRRETRQHRSPALANAVCVTAHVPPLVAEPCPAFKPTANAQWCLVKVLPSKLPDPSVGTCRRHVTTPRRFLTLMSLTKTIELTQSDVEMSHVPRLSQGSQASPRSMILRRVIAHCSLLIPTNSLRKLSALKRRRAGSCGTSSLALLLSSRRQSRSRSSSFDILRSSIMVALSALRRRQFLPPLTETALRT